MKRIFILLFSAFCLFSLMLTSSCEMDSAEDPATISDDNFYTGLGAAIVNCYHDTYNQNLAGKPSGAQSKTVNGPMGGTITITGTTSVDNTHSITTADLVLNMTDVKYTYSFGGTSGKDWVAEVTLTGSSTYSGSFSTTYTSVNHQANNLRVVGSVTNDGIVRNIDQTGSVVINRSTKISVTIFGHTVSW